MNISRVFCLTLCFALKLSLASNPETSACYVSQYQGTTSYELSCSTYDPVIPWVEARPLEAELNSELRMQYDIWPRNITDILENTTSITVQYFHQHLKIGSDTFARFPNLSSLELVSYIFRGRDEPRPQLTIPADGFRDTPKLRSIKIAAHVLSESTVEALGTLKDKVRVLYLQATSPEIAILNQVGKFGKLENVTLYDALGENQLPEDIFKNSSATLREIILVKCDKRTIGNETFGLMPNLVDIRWVGWINAIDPGAFDGLPNLEALLINDNDLDSLPDGLFRNNNKLKEINFRRTMITGLTRANFTHVENFANFSLLTQFQLHQF